MLKDADKKAPWEIAVAKLAATTAQFAAEAKARAAEADVRLTRIEKAVDKLLLESGNRGNERGFAFERAVWGELEVGREICGIHLDGGVRFNVYDKYCFQYDIVGLNGKKTVVIEAKLTLSEDDVHHFADFRLPYFAGMFPEYAKGKEIIGAMVYQRTEDKGKAVAAALGRGLLVLCADSKKRLRHIKTPDDIKERNNPPSRRQKAAR